MGLEGRVRKLEGTKRERETADAETMPDYGKFWELHIEWSAMHLIPHLEPDFTLDGSGAFVTLDGRFGVSHERIDLRGLMAPRTKAIANAPERWRRFLANDEEAADLLELLLELGEATAVPDAYKEPGHKWHEQAQIRERRGDPHGVGGSIFMDAEERGYQAPHLDAYK
jgi:hypothetical protein